MQIAVLNRCMSLRADNIHVILCVTKRCDRTEPHELGAEPAVSSPISWKELYVE
jgi:hypothetical protein